MAGSRLDKLGTIFGRVTGLIRGGALKRENKPIWYDVYQVFPPKIEPSYGTRRPMPEIRKIFYPEDTIRAKFHQNIKSLPAKNLLGTTTATDVTRQTIELTYKILREDGSLTEREAVDKAIKTLKQKGILEARKFRQRKAKLEKTNNATEISEQDDSEMLQASATEESTNSEKPRVRSLAAEYENAVKEISEKNVDISKICKDDN